MDTDTDMKILKGLAQMCVDAHRVMVVQGNDRDLFDLPLLDTVGELGTLAIHLELFTDALTVSLFRAI